MTRTRIKICGLTREEDIAAAVASGADAVGFVFYAKSPRYVSPDRAAVLARAVPPFVAKVGLFVNAPAWEVRDTWATAGLTLVQYHGDETVNQCEAAQLPYLRAVRMRPDTDLLNLHLQYASAQALLLDAFVEGYGGGGQTFDWSCIPANLPSAARARTVLSGGLHAANVAHGMAALQPYAVDVSSGVEAAKGIKDAAKVHQFCEAVRAADAMRSAGA
jgi:phosphoribosylanthranilate isomerase